MSRRACSHCWGDDHDKRKCPNLDKTVEECRREYERENSAYFSAANVIAEILGKYSPEKRAQLALEGFRRAEYQFASPLMAALRERESKASELVKAEIAKWEPVHTQHREQLQARRERRRGKKAPKPRILN